VAPPSDKVNNLVFHSQVQNKARPLHLNGYIFKTCTNLHSFWQTSTLRCSERLLASLSLTVQNRVAPSGERQLVSLIKNKKWLS